MKAASVRHNRERNREHLICRRHFEIERPRDLALEADYVVIADVTAILAQMRGDAVGAGLNGEQGCADGIGMRPATRVPDGRDVIDVDAQSEMGPERRILGHE